ncbi:MAG: DUF2335 domain-containing protein [Nitrospira sp.]|nr:DUF2335 domain-containing protein [Nitrospira sp.]
MSEPERPENADRSEPERPENAPALLEDRQLLRRTKVSVWEGPLPAPDILNKYDPDTRRAIVAMAEKEQNHRHARSDKGQREGSKSRNFGFVLALGTLISGVYLADAGKPFFFPISIFTSPSLYRRNRFRSGFCVVRKDERKIKEQET